MERANPRIEMLQQLLGVTEIGFPHTQAISVLVEVDNQLGRLGLLAQRGQAASRLRRQAALELLALALTGRNDTDDLDVTGAFLAACADLAERGDATTRWSEHPYDELRQAVALLAHARPAYRPHAVGDIAVWAVLAVNRETPVN